jgi:hypothetical protein
MVAVADTQAHHYLLLTIGEQKGQKVHSVDLHLKIERFSNDDNRDTVKVIVDLDNTEWYVPQELEAEGIATEDLVDVDKPLTSTKLL